MIMTIDEFLTMTKASPADAAGFRYYIDIETSVEMVPQPQIIWESVWDEWKENT